MTDVELSKYKFTKEDVEDYKSFYLRVPVMYKFPNDNEELENS